jgi:hypothetical protein
MADTSITVEYTITSITHTSNGLSTVVWSMSHDGTALEEDRTGDKFKTADLSTGISSTDSDYDKGVKVQRNFEDIASPYFKSFAVRVRLAQDQSFANYLDDQTGEVGSLSTSDKPIKGTVIVS